MSLTLDKLSLSFKEVQDFMDSIRNVSRTAQYQISLLESRLNWGPDAAADTQAATKRTSELELALKQAQLDKARMQLAKENSENTLAETRVELSKANKQVIKLEVRLRESQIEAEKILKQVKEACDSVLAEALAKQELSQDLRISEMKAEAELERHKFEKQLSLLEERNVDLNLAVRDLEAWKQGVLDRQKQFDEDHQKQRHELHQKQQQQWHFDKPSEGGGRTVGRATPKMPASFAHDMEEERTYSNWDREARRMASETFPTPVANKRKRVSFSSETPNNEGKTAASIIGKRLLKTPRSADKGRQSDSSSSDPKSAAKRPLFDSDHK